MSKKTWIILIAELVIFVNILITVNKCNSDKIDILNHNINAYKDSIEVIKCENGELILTKESLILTEEQVREELEMTKTELKSLKKKLNSDIAYIAKLESKLELKDTVYMKADTVYTYNDYTVKTFDWSDKWINIKSSISGNTIQDSKLGITSLKMDVPLTIGLTDNYKFFVTSENPYVEFTDIKSNVIYDNVIYDSVKEKKISHGFNVGFGFQYGMFGKSWDFGPQIGYSLQFNF